MAVCGITNFFIQSGFECVFTVRFAVSLSLVTCHSSLITCHLSLVNCWKKEYEVVGLLSHPSFRGMSAKDCYSLV